MKRKILLCLFALFLTISLTACGTQNNNNGNNNQQNTGKKENNDVIIDDEDNAPPKEGRVVVEKIINCDGCVFAYSSKEPPNALKIGDTLSSSEYTNDINDLKTAGGKQRHNFFGFVLSGGKISKAYACILKDNKIYCIQGGGDGAYQSSNIAVLNQIFTADQCKTISDGHNYRCTDGSYNGNTITTGAVTMHYETGCTIYATDSRKGELICH